MGRGLAELLIVVAMFTPAILRGGEPEEHPDIRISRYVFTWEFAEHGNAKIFIEKSPSGEFVIIESGKHTLRMKPEGAAKLALAIESPEIEKPAKKPTRQRPQRPGAGAAVPAAQPTKIRVERRQVKPGQFMLVIGDSDVFTDNLIQISEKDAAQIVKSLKLVPQAIALAKEKLAF